MSNTPSAGPKLLDVTKPVQTREGNPARILCADKEGPFPIVTVYAGTVLTHTIDGYFLGPTGPTHKWDLINVSEPEPAYAIAVFKDVKGNISVALRDMDRTLCKEWVARCKADGSLIELIPYKLP